jgi:hypothetical protein
MVARAPLITTSGLLAGLLGLFVGLAPAMAQGTFYPGARPLGLGGAMRAVATGDAGPLLNPSGISLGRAYTLEGGYQYGNRLDTQDFRVSAVDSTTAINLGGALYYSYHHDAPASGLSQNGHLGGASLSFPFLDKVFLGGNIKYLHFRDAADATHSGWTFDAGLTIRPLPQVSIAAVGYNLREVVTAWAPLGVGGGAAVSPMPSLLFVFDAVWTKVYGDPTRDNALSLMGGAEVSVAATAYLRAGGGRDGLGKNGYVSGGVTVLSVDMGALDVGVRRDVSGESKNTLVGLTARLFVPGTL